MFYYLYKITNTLNNKIYIGVHQTSDLNDGYFGSGLNLHRAIKKYGKENFVKEIIEHFNDKESMLFREKQVVNADFVSLDTTYNIVEGGHGSFSYINTLPNQGHQPGQQTKAAKIAGLKHRDRMLNDAVYRKKYLATSSHGQLLSWTKERKGNAKGNTIWVSNFDLNKSQCIPYALYPHYYDQGWIKGRKFNRYNNERDLYKKRN